ncbi:MAG: DNA recombination protein RmuC [Lachnospiraceae bacterium]|nr:DNA recombination protein RmuC [Lachnospiraceae bacterium]
MDIVIIALLAVVIVLLIIVLVRQSAAGGYKKTISESEERILSSIDDLSDNQIARFSDMKIAVNESGHGITDKINEQFSDMIRKDAEARQNSNDRMSEGIAKMQQSMEVKMGGLKDDLSSGLKDINEKLVETVKENAESQQKISDNLSESLSKIQNMTEEKLLGIQKEVNDKLDASLNKRLDESFEKVTNQLTQLYKSLGELGEMSDGIANLNKTLSNVKTRGTWGEIQLGSILEQTMTDSQYTKNVKVKKNSEDLVEFAIKIPSRDDEEKPVLLPIDSKFPLDIYGNLVDAADDGNKEAYEKYSKELENRIKSEAKTIRDKYVNPPVTTDFAIMFLPTESLYAEVLRINGLAEFCQNKYRIIIASPSTITALLNSLRVGFANIALNKKTAEVRKILEAVKAQYGIFDELIETTKKKLQAAVTSTDELKDRTVKIRNKMSKIGEIDQKESDAILLIEEDTENA